MEIYCIESSLAAEIRNRDFYSFTGISGGYLIYSQMIKYILCDRPKALNMITKQVEAIDIKEVANVYANAYDIGRKQFHSVFKPDAEPEFLLDKYNGYYDGWKRLSEQINHVVSEDSIYKIGLNSGIRYEFEIYREKKRKEFEAVEKIIDNLQKPDYTPPPKPFAGLLRDLNNTQLDKLFTFLTTINNGYSKPTFIDKENTDRDSFNHIFGNTEKPNNFIPIEWKANNYYLGDILESLQVKKTYDKNGVLQLSNEVKRQAAKYFNKDGKPITTLQKSKSELHKRTEYKKISEFLATI